VVHILFVDVNFILRLANKYPIDRFAGIRFGGAIADLFQCL